MEDNKVPYLDYPPYVWFSRTNDGNLVYVDYDKKIISLTLKGGDPNKECDCHSRINFVSDTEFYELLCSFLEFGFDALQNKI